jgi:hypothetical protein
LAADEAGCSSGIIILSKQSLPADVVAFLDAVGVEVGRHRLREFLLALAAGAVDLDGSDRPAEAEDMLLEMQRLAGGQDVTRMLERIVPEITQVHAYLSKPRL